MLRVSAVLSNYHHSRCMLPQFVQMLVADGGRSHNIENALPLPHSTNVRSSLTHATLIGMTSYPHRKLKESNARGPYVRAS